MDDNNHILCQKVLSGDSLAFEQFVTNYTKEIHHYCYRFLFNENDAQELTQQSFFKFFLNIQSIKKNCKSFLYAIARSGCIDEIKRKKKLKLFSHFQSQHDETDESVVNQNYSDAQHVDVENIITFNRFKNIIQSIIDASYHEIDAPSVEAIKNKIKKRLTFTPEERLLIQFVILEGHQVSEAGRRLGLSVVHAQNMFRRIKKELKRFIPKDVWIKKL